MAFSFNWAGITLPAAQKADNTSQMLDTASKFGSAAHGYVVDRANKEYAEMLEGRNKNAVRVMEIQKEIEQLERRNAMIDQQLANAGRDFAPNAGRAVEPNEMVYSDDSGQEYI